MGWRERFGVDDERAQIAARARALLDAAGSRPSSGAVMADAVMSGAPSSGAPWSGAPSSGGAEAAGDATAPPLPPPRGGWVPAFAPLEVDPPAGGVSGSAAVEPTVGERRPAGPSGAWWEQHGSAPVPRVPWRERVRFDPGRRGLVAVAAVVVVVGSIAGGVLVRGSQSSAVTLAAASGAAPSLASAAPVAGSSGSGGPPAPTVSPASSPVGTVTVDVAGLVTRPGVYTLPAGSRVDDALAAAGGAKPGADLSTLNRARVLVDGEQLAVGVPGAVAPAVPTAGGSAAGTSGGSALVNLNTAGLADLDTLPGVGPVLGQAILDWRTDHGRFSSVDDLQQVSGIGPSRFADLKDLVTV